MDFSRNASSQPAATWHWKNNQPTEGEEYTSSWLKSFGGWLMILFPSASHQANICTTHSTISHNTQPYYVGSINRAEKLQTHHPFQQFNSIQMQHRCAHRFITFHGHWSHRRFQNTHHNPQTTAFQPSPEPNTVHQNITLFQNPSRALPSPILGGWAFPPRKYSSSIWILGAAQPCGRLCEEGDGGGKQAVIDWGAETLWCMGWMRLRLRLWFGCVTGAGGGWSWMCSTCLFKRRGIVQSSLSIHPYSIFTQRITHKNSHFISSMPHFFSNFCFDMPCHKASKVPLVVTLRE